jgi:uncharacterized protein YciI
MKYYAVFLPMISPERSQQFRPEHLEFLAKGREEGWVFANGKFADGSGGLVIYAAESVDEVLGKVKQDPYVRGEARGYEIHEWDMVTRTPLS